MGSGVVTAMELGAARVGSLAIAEDRSRQRAKPRVLGQPMVLVKAQLGMVSRKRTGRSEGQKRKFLQCMVMLRRRFCVRNLTGLLGYPRVLLQKRP